MTDPVNALRMDLPSVPSVRATMDNVVPGTALIDSFSGPCLATGRPRRVAGGAVVDVVSNRPVPGYRWTACLCNLHLSHE
jgi:hypothetical protein